jgi:hypothetical protein
MIPYKSEDARGWSVLCRLGAADAENASIKRLHYMFKLYLCNNLYQKIDVTVRK